MPLSVIGPNPPNIAINPLQVVLQPLASQTFVATTSGGTPGTITWSVDGIAGGNATVGTIDSSGNYVAPAAAGKHSISAGALVGDTNVLAQAAVNVIASATSITVQTTVPSAVSYIGALVFDSTSGVLYVYTAGGWVTA